VKGIERGKGSRGERDRESEREPVLSKPNPSPNAFPKFLLKGSLFESKPNPSPNAFPKLCEWLSGRFRLKGRGTVPSLRVKSS
jgi:hypothetical protein